MVNNNTTLQCSLSQSCDPLLNSGIPRSIYMMGNYPVSDIEKLCEGSIKPSVRSPYTDDDEETMRLVLLDSI